VATEFNQLTASFSASCRIVSLPSNLVCRQESTHGLVWGSPHEQFGDCVSPHLYNEALQGSWPVWKRFNKDHEQRGRSKPGWRVVESTTMAWLLPKLTASSLSTVWSCPQVTNLTRWDVVMKVVEVCDWKHQHELASVDGSLFWTTSCPRLTSDASLMEKC